MPCELFNSQGNQNILFIFIKIIFYYIGNKIWKINSIFWSNNKFSFFNPFRFLYWRVVIPDHAFVISSVRIAYSTPCFTPRESHSSVSSFLTCIAWSLWFIHSLLYPFFQICFKGSLYGKFRVYGFINPLTPYFCKPHFERFCFWRRDWLY